MKLYGVAVSNFYNKVKLALLEKNLEFEEVWAPPSQSPDILEHSPLGKIPYFQHQDLYLCESQAILFYLEVYQPGPRLYPTSPQESGRAQQIHQFIDLYIDPPARELLGMAFFGAPRDAEQIKASTRRLKAHAMALSRLVVMAPFIAGDRLTHADLAAVTTLGFAHAISERLAAADPLAQIPGIGEYMAMMEERPSLKRVHQDQARALERIESAARHHSQASASDS